ncbi:right-handed parallel beta-helix repeat-containing protein [Rhodopirellula sp. JC740]|uniref:Right-handed parallel beta-helix repeat-containing protein n=1 Tax=Rhodopirellula halodulae TaxID=2894198 RepID=A0ABS8NLY2_9BACT|nr:right-handed parallel beta-helix repeat-containing protein [Rhodopirellula sp. JC740]MCC9644584.1 right-handed parallel beta-helix repeat-containing protein [Rhodopirellula sp. JC740]
MIRLEPEQKELCNLKATLLCWLISATVFAQVTAAGDPVLRGHAFGRFEIGEVIAQDSFENLDQWEVQIEPQDGFPKPDVRAEHGELNCLLPGRGCTLWFRKPLPNRIAICYDVICPSHSAETPGVEPRDLNQFWMATDPHAPAESLFDSQRYSGKFTDYDRIEGYYASSGGRGNETTRMRRYPRTRDGRSVPHVALKSQDQQRAYLIQPDRKMSVQLVAYDDLVQYLIDGKLIYQFQHGDSVTLESRDDSGTIVDTASEYSAETFPVKKQGYFGFRMVKSHHVYSNFRVHRLEPASTRTPRPVVQVDSISSLRECVQRDSQQIIMKPGDYWIRDRNGVDMSGSGNDLNLTGVTIHVALESASGRDVFRVNGNNNTVRGGTVVDEYPPDVDQPIDYASYNRKHKFGKMNEFVIRGSGNSLIGMKLIIRGSYPYGYGNMYGIGGGSVVRLRKHCGIQIRGDDTVIDSCDVKMEAFGHAIYTLRGNRTTVRHTHVEGTVRRSNELYAEKHRDDLAKRHGYQLQWPEDVRGLPIPRDHMINCTEDGIRAYKGAVEMIVENCRVQKTRGGIKLYMAKKAIVRDCQVLDCVIQGYSLPSRGVMENCSGNAAYGPLLYVHSDSHREQQIDLQVLPAPHSLGDHPLAAIKGKRHKIRLWSDTATRETPRPIVVGYPQRFDFLSVDYPAVPKGHESHFEKLGPHTYEASEIDLQNQTSHPVVLGPLSRHNTITSQGEVKDLGQENVTQSAGS